MRQIILDTETTGLKAKEGHRIIEIAAVEMDNRKLTGRHFHEYICPKRGIDAGALKIHGITEKFLADKPLFHQIIAPLLDFITGAELIIHNAPFDISFLDSEFAQAGAHYKAVKDYCTVLDTLALARKKHPSQANNLDALCKRYKIDNSNRELHGALLDAHLLASVYLAMTGGQTSLFGDAESEEMPAFNMDTTEHSLNTTHTAQIFEDDLPPLTVIRANPEELAAHLQIMANLTPLAASAEIKSHHG